MKISTLLHFLDPNTTFPNVAINGVCDDSRAVYPGALFIALPGARVDGTQYIDDAIAAGAQAVLCVGKALGVQSYKGFH